MTSERPVEALDIANRAPGALATQFRYFGQTQAPQLDSPLYAELCEGVAADREMLELVSHTDITQPAPNMLFAAAQYLLLLGASHPLVAFYPALTGAPRPDGPAFPAFRDFCLAHRARIEPLLATRRTQTNVLRRCSCLLPAFATVSQRHGRRPLAIVEIGTSAGLNLLWDRYHYRYSDGLAWGDPASPVALDAELRGGTSLPDLPPSIAVASRVGIDIAPIDLSDVESVAWLRALIWPEHVDRHVRLQAAVELARSDPPEIVAADATVAVDEVMDRAPADATLCVFATHALYQVPRDARVRLYRTLQQRAADRSVDFLSMEGTGTDHSELFWTRYRGTERETEKLANCNPHGWWLEWLGASADAD